MNKESNVNYIKNAYDDLLRTNFNEKTIFYTLDILARLIEINPQYRNEKNYLMAAVYIASHQLNYVHSTINLDDFCSDFNLDQKIIDSAIKKIIDELNFFLFPSDSGEPFFIDKQAVIYSLISSITKKRFNEAILSKVLGLSEFDLDELADELSNYLIYKIKIVSEHFSKSCRDLIVTIFKELM